MGVSPVVAPPPGPPSSGGGATITGIATVRHPHYPNLVWVLVESSNGEVGLGETFFNGEAVVGYIAEIVAPFLLGKHANAINDHWHSLWRQWGRAGIGTEARASSAVDIALWDLAGKHRSLPLYDCLGGKVRDSIGVYNTCAGPTYGRVLPLPGEMMFGEAGTGNYEDLEAFHTDAGALAKDLLAMDITAMKIWPFDVVAHRLNGDQLTARDIDEGRAAFESVRDAVGFDMDVALDLHNKWSFPAAGTLLHALEDLRLMWYEDPIEMNGALVLRDLTQRLDTPILGSERLGSRFAFRDYLEVGAIDIVMADPLWVGGVTECRRVAELAATYGRPFTPHDCTGPVGLAVGVHLCLHCDNALIQEFVRAYYFGWYDAIAEGLPKLNAGRLSPANGYGHGVSLRPSFLDECDTVWHRE